MWPPPCQSISPISSSPFNIGQIIGKKNNTYLHGVFCKYYDDLEQWFPSSKMVQKAMKTAQNSSKIVQKYLLPHCQKRSTAEFFPRCWAAEASGPQTCHDAPAPASHAVSPGGVGVVEGLGGWILYYMHIILYILCIYKHIILNMYFKYYIYIYAQRLGFAQALQRRGFPFPNKCWCTFTKFLWEKQQRY